MAPDANAPLIDSQLSSLRSAELFDKDGAKTTFGELTGGKNIAVVFIRHFWCGNCQAYTSHLSRSIPPSNLAQNTSIIIIGCGSHPAIPAYLNLTHSAYPVYANPSLSLYKALDFTVNLGASKKGEEKGYEQDLGGTFTRVYRSIMDGPVKNLGQAGVVGPKMQNGGEMVLRSDGTCKYIHRMQHTADHTEISELAEMLGATYTLVERRGSTVEAGEKKDGSGVAGAEKRRASAAA